MSFGLQTVASCASASHVLLSTLRCGSHKPLENQRFRLKIHSIDDTPYNLTLSMNKRIKLLFQIYDLLQQERLKRQSNSWLAIARPNQHPPLGDWRTWLILAGRGFGKTRTGAETIAHWAYQKKYQQIALIANNELEGRSIMVEGESGLLRLRSPWMVPAYEPSKRRLQWPNGAIATLFSAENYEQLRGPQFDAAWIDELAKFAYPQATWDQLMFALRLGKDPRVVITTTPRPIPLLKELMQRQDVVVTTGTTFDNQQNLAPQFIEEMQRKYSGTSLGQQELYAQIIEEQNTELWNRAILQRCRAFSFPPREKLAQVVIGVDPAISNHSDSNETGIIVAAADDKGIHYVIADLSGRYQPNEWAKIVLDAYQAYRARIIVAEINQGGDLIETILHTNAAMHSLGGAGSFNFKAIRATNNKYYRAQPIAALYGQERVLHCQEFPQLERQMVEFTFNYKTSPDRVDALVMALTELIYYKQQEYRAWF